MLAAKEKAHKPYEVVRTVHAWRQRMDVVGAILLLL